MDEQNNSEEKELKRQWHPPTVKVIHINQTEGTYSPHPDETTAGLLGPSAA